MVVASIVAIAVENVSEKSILPCPIFHRPNVTTGLLYRVFTDNVFAVSVLLLPVIVACMMVLHSVRELVMRMRHVIVITVAVLVLPTHFLSFPYHGSVEMVERVRVTAGLRFPVEHGRPSQNKRYELSEGKVLILHRWSD